MKHNFDLINKYRINFQLNGYMGNHHQITREFLENHNDTYLISRIRNEVIKELNRMVEKRMVKKKTVDFHKMNELIVVADDIARIFNQIHSYRIIKNTVCLTGMNEKFINVCLKDDTQKEMVKLKTQLDQINK